MRTWVPEHGREGIAPRWAGLVVRPSPQFTGISVMLCPFLVSLELMTQFYISKALSGSGIFMLVLLLSAKSFATPCQSSDQNFIQQLTPLTKNLFTDTPLTAGSLWRCLWGCSEFWFPFGSIQPCSLMSGRWGLAMKNASENCRGIRTDLHLQTSRKKWAWLSNISPS